MSSSQYPFALEVQFFYDRQTFMTQNMVDFAVGGYIGDKTLEELVKICKLLSSNSQQKTIWGKRASVHEVSTRRDLSSRVAELSTQMQQMQSLLTHETH